MKIALVMVFVVLVLSGCKADMITGGFVSVPSGEADNSECMQGCIDSCSTAECLQECLELNCELIS